MLYLIGLGLGDAKDITVKGLEVVRRCSRVYLEAYTSVLTVGKEALEEFYGRELILADREEVEQEADGILKDADTSDVAFLVVGDPFGATTHSDLVLRATKLGIPYRVVHNASIMNAVGCCGLQLYRFGETVSIVFWTDTWKPESFFDKVKRNRQNGMHTLCLLASELRLWLTDRTEVTGAPGDCEVALVSRSEGESQGSSLPARRSGPLTFASCPPAGVAALSHGAVPSSSIGCAAEGAGGARF
ncbi:diphthine methyl ester synthase isoform X2 [Desmodus rotundus]|uniref:diphthine methyl ester synthase isoform X2 n=1 Tax=Desmodus rotundus TaxID=9430 RepID=UPI002381656A|nr:diphthine methyl ester synthase isoform X2 [Desmodus rotundus]